MTCLWHRKLMMIAAFLAANGACAQWNFRLDTTFRTDIVERSVNSIALLGTGDLLLSGVMRFPDDEFDRLIGLVDGQGQRVTSFPYGYGGGKLTAWQDRFYVSVGQTVRRIFPNGTADPDFIGLNLGPYFGSAAGGDYHVFPDGRLLISGMHMLRDSVRGFLGMHNLIWFTNTGYLDTTRVHRKSDDGIIYDLAQLPDGGFIFTSNFNEFDGLPVDWIFRTDSLGIPDTNFRTGVFWGQAYCYLPLDDGRIYVGGNFRTTQAPGDTLRLVRLLPDGSLDPTFHLLHFTAGGGLSTPFGANIHQLAPWKNGTFLVAGQFLEVDGHVRKGLCLIDSTGQLLPAFDGQGVGPFYDGWLTGAAVIDLLITPDSTALYICGAYVGYNDGTINDSQQRFMSRLLVEELHVGEQEEVAAPQPGPSLRLHPNPATAWVTIQHRIPGHSGAVHVVVRDAQGRPVQQLRSAASEGQLVLDTRALAPAVYTVELVTTGAPLLTQRLVVQP